MSIRIKATFELVEQQPDRETMRLNANWQEWATREAKEWEKMKKPTEA